MKLISMAWAKRQERLGKVVIQPGFEAIGDNMYRKVIYPNNSESAYIFLRRIPTCL